MSDTTPQPTQTTKYRIDRFSATFGQDSALRDVTLSIPEHEIFGIIGPSGAGKTTFLRCLNRLNDLRADFQATGQILLDGQDIYHPGFDVVKLRRRVGIVFALPVPLPLTIHDNITYGPKLSGIRDRNRLNTLVETSLQSAFLWNEVKDRLHTPALRLSGGQQQRLCLARALALEPEVVLLDEPCSGLDPISTARIEEAMTALKSRYTFILVTNNTKQAARVADRTAFFLMGELVEVGPTKDIFTVPQDKRTNDYVTGRFG